MPGKGVLSLVFLALCSGSGFATRQPFANPRVDVDESRYSEAFPFLPFEASPVDDVLEAKFPWDKATELGSLAATFRHGAAQKLLQGDRNGALLLLKPFSWQDCSDPKSPVRLRNLSVAPVPMEIPGLVWLGIKIPLPAPLTKPIAASVRIFKMIFGEWRQAPCIGQFGSCDYEDLCNLLEKFFPDRTCPAAFAAMNASCHCPLPTTQLDRVIPLQLKPPPMIPLSALIGDYRLRLTMSGPIAAVPGKYSLCFEVNFSVAQAPSKEN